MERRSPLASDLPEGLFLELLGDEEVKKPMALIDDVNRSIWLDRAEMNSMIGDKQYDLKYISRDIV
jgi:hypothetical protein